LLDVLSYLFVLTVGAAGVALVAGVVEVDALSLQPVTKAPITSPNSTIKVYVLFISGATFDEFPEKASSFFGVLPVGPSECEGQHGLVRPKQQG
jgi:hypothetical protein